MGEDIYNDLMMEVKGAKNGRDITEELGVVFKMN